MKTHRLQALNSLAACLRGEVPSEIDWFSTIALANESMTTTNLGVRMLSVSLASDLPEDAKIFLTEVLVRNGQRNERLIAQLTESILALNADGITPVLLKGAAILVNQASFEKTERMVSDLDLLVKCEELCAAVTALENIGYRIFERSGSPEGPVTLARVSDVGMVDIHTRPRGPMVLAASQELYNACQTAKLGASQALIPSPTFQLLHFVLHDQFHSRDYWKGSLDLRHLCDLARIVTQHDIDWKFLRSLFSNRSSANSFACQMIQVKRLLGAPMPSHFSQSLVAKFQYWRILAQLRFPYLRVPFTCLTILMGWNHRNRDTVEYDIGVQRRLGGRLRGIWRLLRARTTGKI